MRFEYTKTFKSDLHTVMENKPALEKLVRECIKDFQENLFGSRFYRKPLKGFHEDIHELQV